MCNLKVYGADVSIAFAEAPPLVAPLYIRVDKPYCEWYCDKGYGEIPEGHVLKVKRTLQGHPEAARQWALLIYGLLRKEILLTPTTHEPCLYSGTHQNTPVLFLCQVDNFAIACPDESIAQSMIDQINEHMSVQIKYLGLLTCYNGVDVDQTGKFIKIYNTTYINKILAGHKKWFQPQTPCHNYPIPMKSESSYIKTIEQAIPPSTDKARVRLQREMKLNYCQVIGELIYAMVTC